MFIINIDEKINYEYIINGELSIAIFDYQRQHFGCWTFHPMVLPTCRAEWACSLSAWRRERGQNGCGKIYEILTSVVLKGVQPKHIPNLIKTKSR